MSALSDYIFISKYARWQGERRETKNEAIDRMVDMHREKYPEASGYIDDVADALHGDRILGSQRALQYGGDPIKKKNARLFNCTVSYCDRPRFFQEAFWLLLCGCGTGFSVQKHHVAKFPEIGRPKGNGSTRTYRIPDTIEGWADALGELVNSYFNPSMGRVVFDYDLIRPEGAPLSSGSGKAPGPDPLRKALDLIRGLLEECVDRGTRLRPVDAYDVIMHASDAVLSGGVRRSASICIFSLDDEEMLNAKTGNWFQENPQRGRSNNSALLLRGSVTREEFEGLFEKTRQWGEPGFYWSDSAEFIPNPCVEIGMKPVHHITGESGWQMCNLSTVNVEECATHNDFIESCRMAAYIGTMQAGYTDLGYLGEVSQQITEHEALIGVSMTGMMRNPEIAFDEDLLAIGAQQVLVANAEMADLIGINHAARSTCLKPEGTGSLMLQTTPGIRADHAPRSLRRVQANPNEEPFKMFASTNPGSIEESSWREGDSMIVFAEEAPRGAVVRSQIDAIEMLEKVLMVKRAWVDGGKRPHLCTDPMLSHNVSNTIDVGDGEWDEVARFIYDNRETLAGVSLLADTGDIDYQQAPFTAVLSAEELVAKYGEGVMFASGLIVDGIHAYGDLWVACDTAVSGPTAIKLDDHDADASRHALRVDWIRRFINFSARHMDGDTRETVHCLKHVHNLKLWHDLRRTEKLVDYTKMDEEDGTDITIQGTVACAGGACLMPG